MVVRVHISPVFALALIPSGQIRESTINWSPFRFEGLAYMDVSLPALFSPGKVNRDYPNDVSG